MSDYKPDVLRRLQCTELDIFKAMAAFCDEHHIEYFAIYGTMLGAVRHQGFIPWDDDMDVGMPRKDYERFLELIHANPVPGYEVLDIEHTNGYDMPFCKMCKENTTFVEKTDTYRTYHSGIFIDIYPFDETPADPAAQKRHYKAGWVWGRMCVLANNAHPKLPDMNPVLSAVAGFGCLCIHGLMKVFGMTKLRMYKHFLKATCKYDGTNTGWWLDMTTPDTWNTILPVASVYPLQKLPFEGFMMQTIADTDKYLTGYYGDYMTLPAPDKQHNHAPAQLDFDR